MHKTRITMHYVSRIANVLERRRRPAWCMNNGALESNVHVVALMPALGQWGSASQIYFSTLSSAGASPSSFSEVDSDVGPSRSIRAHPNRSPSAIINSLVIYAREGARSRLRACPYNVRQKKGGTRRGRGQEEAAGRRARVHLVSRAQSTAHRATECFGNALSDLILLQHL
jgi:hypothetical protein